MRHIEIKGEPDEAWLKKAGAVLQKLEAAGGPEERKQIIDDNDHLWGELKEWLLALSSEKCWFSEAKDGFNHWEVEHYRPKKSAKDEDGRAHDGYWWLAFDWRNFRICGSAGNRKKGTFFPVRDGTSRAKLHGDLRQEQPKLLDPVDEDDHHLLSFDFEGRAVPAPWIHNDWERARVTYSVERYNLDFPALMNKRKAVWAECWTLIKEFQAELALYHRDKDNVVAREGSKRAVKRLRELIKADKELSGVAVACIRSCGDARVANIMA